MRCFSLFSGIGGFDLAAKRLGHEIVGACEIDRYARQVYAKHFPNVTIYEDATKINPDNLPDFDILVAGFPCQAFSIAGQRRGFEDTRGTLFFEIARIAKEKRPHYLLLENVKGLLSHEGGQTIRTMYQTLDEMGYDTESHVINTKDFLPQNRERIFIIATLRGTSRREIFPIRETIQQSDKRNPKEQVANSLQCPGHSCGNYKGMNIITLTPCDTGQCYRIYDDKGISPSLRSSCEDRNDKNIIISTKSKLRRLTPTEYERLQGFEDGYTAGISDTQRYKCLGNAVTVLVVEHIMEKLS